MKKLFCILLTLILCVSALASCKDRTKDDEKTVYEEHNVKRCMINLDDAEMPIFLTAENHPDFEGKKDLINAAYVMSNNKGGIVKVNTCANYGNTYSGTYEVSGEHLEDATFCFELKEQIRQPIACSVNYYDHILQGSALNCDYILVTYGESVEMKGVTSDFEIFVYVFSDDCPLQFDESIITVSGNLAESGNINLEWKETKFTLISDIPIAACKAVAEVSNRSEQYAAEADAEGTEFEISVSDGKPVIKVVK